MEVIQEALEPDIIIEEPESNLEDSKHNVFTKGGKLPVHGIVRTYKCGQPGCDKVYTCKQHLSRHIRSVHIIRDFPIMYSCPECANMYANKQNLNRHLKTVHYSAKSHKCDVCGELFKKKHLLTSHMHKHTFVKGFSCILCNKEFVTRSEKKRHMKYHKTYNCEHCNLVFDHWSKYLKHKKEDHQFTEFICDYCERKFTKRDHIVRHVKTHINTTPAITKNPKVYYCPYEECDRSYTRNSNLKQHIKINHMDIRHACHLCDAKLCTKAKLQYHIQAVHVEPKPLTVRTLQNGRKERKDKGTVKKTCTALRISGLVVPEDDIETYPEEATTEEFIAPLFCEAKLDS